VNAEIPYAPQTHSHMPENGQMAAVPDLQCYAKRLQIVCNYKNSLENQPEKGIKIPSPVRIRHLARSFRSGSGNGKQKMDAIAGFPAICHNSQKNRRIPHCQQIKT